MSLVQSFTVETDTREQLVLAISILLKWTHRVTHYRVGVDMYKRPYLVLMWNEGEKTQYTHVPPKHGTPLMAPMESAESIADQIFAWLKTQEYGTQPDHDGSNSKGFRVSSTAPIVSRVPNTYHRPDQEWSSQWNNTYDSTSYDFVYVTPAWIEYHK